MDLGFDPRKVGGLTKDLAESLSRVFQNAALSAERQHLRFQKTANALLYFSKHGHCQTNSVEDTVCGGECEICRPEIMKTYEKLKEMNR